MTNIIIIDFRKKNDPMFKEEFILLGNINDKNYKLFSENKIGIEKIICDFKKLKHDSQIFLLFSDDEDKTKKIFLEKFFNQHYSTISISAKELIKTHPEYLSLFPPRDNHFFPMRSFSIIFPNLYISDMFCAQNKQIFDLFQIRAVINVSAISNENAFEEKLPYLSIFEEDRTSTNLSSYFSLTNRFIDKYIECGGVLVHCSAGISRSSTIILAYIMYKKRKTFEDAYQYLQDKHPITDPNLGFIIQLQQYEKELDL